MPFAPKGAQHRLRFLARSLHTCFGMSWRRLWIAGMTAATSAGCGDGRSAPLDASDATDAAGIDASVAVDVETPPDVVTATGDARDVDITDHDATDALVAMVDSQHERDFPQADASATDAAYDTDAANADAGACNGIASCPFCQCTPTYCIAGNPLEATTCTPDGQRAGFVDRCACEGKTCEAGLTCVRVFNPPPFALGGPGGSSNGCFELCGSDADCLSQRVCLTNLHGLKVCVGRPACLSDADCTADACGHCLPKGEWFHAGARYLDPSRSECAYEGRCVASSCAGCSEDFFRASAGGSFHLCSP